MDQLTLGDMTITWLSGGENHLDGGAMFGVVPKVMWSKKYPCSEQNLIKLRTDPLLLQYKGKNIVIDSGLGNEKLTEKQLKIFAVTEQSRIHESLQLLGISENDIDMVLMSHLHFDHACGLSKWEGENLAPVFPNAIHYIQRIEWDEIQNPNIRSRNTYWEINWKPITELVQTFDDSVQVMDGIHMIHTGGHSRGHAIIQLQSRGERAYHLGDIMPTHAHLNPLWVMAYDDYPMDSIYAKQKWIGQAMKEEAWFLFYHDPYVRAIKWDKEGNELDRINGVATK